MENNNENIRVLLIEDDYQLGDVVTAFLQASSILVEHCQLAEDGLAMFDSKAFDCVVLDLTLPDEDGLVVLRKLTTKSDVPVIICSARGEVTDRITGFEFGASDYLPKPFSVKELLLRIRALLKRQGKQKPENNSVKLHHFDFDDEAKSLHNTLNDERISLTQKEFLLLKLMAQRPGRVYSRAELIDAASGINGPETERAMDVVITRLRKKIEQCPKTPKILKTAVGFGYFVERRSHS